MSDSVGVIKQTMRQVQFSDDGEGHFRCTDVISTLWKWKRINKRYISLVPGVKMPRDHLDNIELYGRPVYCKMS
jgi:hypothetical protein